MRRSKLILLFLVSGLLSGCSLVQQNAFSDSFSCNDYDWTGVERLVAPHLDGSAYTSVVMQGQSMEYRTSGAADQALAYRYDLPDDVVRTLERIRRHRC